MGGRTVAGHERKATPLSPIPGPRQSPKDGWAMSCACGWVAQPFARRADAEKAYGAHLLDALPICQGCNTKKPTREMSKSAPHKCKACARAAIKAWAEANPSEWERSRWKSHLKRQYGITPERYNEILASQGGLCAICLKSPADPRGFRPHLDHDHATGQVRGILCGPCNKGLGMFGDELAVIRSALAYLEKHSKEVAIESIVD